MAGNLPTAEECASRGEDVLMNRLIRVALFVWAAASEASAAPPYRPYVDPTPRTLYDPVTGNSSSLQVTREGGCSGGDGSGGGLSEDDSGGVREELGMHRRLVFALNTVMIVAASWDVCAGDWPTYRADAARTGYTAGEQTTLDTCRAVSKTRYSARWKSDSPRTGARGPEPLARKSSSVDSPVTSK